MFVPIKLEDYVEKHLKSNRGEKRSEVTAALKDALKRYHRGAVCFCGEPIWVIGSSVLGDICFTCATLEADSSDDYEIDEACDKWGKARTQAGIPSRTQPGAAGAVAAGSGGQCLG